MARRSVTMTDRERIAIAVAREWAAKTGVACYAARDPETGGWYAVRLTGWMGEPVDAVAYPNGYAVAGNRRYNGL